ncbi:MAG TPA: DUF1622 domain-containing protein [Candidatus Saccharimonadales bacterium]|nr:DUF1622 domain-containing protein [Candidatus Saccharimonadales bacterium]
MSGIDTFAQNAGAFLDNVGVLVILAGFGLATIAALVSVTKRATVHTLYKKYRHNLARSVLLGLEFLVAGDIIRSVTGSLNLRTVLVLAMIVGIRTLISLEFETEIEGRFPWQRARKA